MSFFRKKTFISIEQNNKDSGLSKTLTAFDLILLGLGAIIGTGVFVFTGLGKVFGISSNAFPMQSQV